MSLFFFLFKRKVAGGEGSPRRRLNFSRGTCYPTKRGYIYIYIYSNHFIILYELGEVVGQGGGWKGEGRWKRRAPRKMFEDIKLFRCWKLYPLKINKPSRWKRGKMVAVCVMVGRERGKWWVGIKKKERLSIRVLSFRPSLLLSAVYFPRKVSISFPFIICLIFVTRD